MKSSRVQSVDLLRGAVMAIMAIDHVRDFLHRDAYLYSPEDLTRTNGLLFFTRWITHFCAPVFVFLAGVSIHLAMSRRDRPAAAKHLVTRGLRLILLEFTVLEFMWTFNFRYELVMIQVIWVIGWAMILLAPLLWVPRNLVAAGAVAMIALHNTLDGVKAAQFGALAPLWNVLHAPNLLQVGHTQIFVLYPLIPWVAVLAAGYCFGPILQMEDQRRRRLLLTIGAALTALFFIVRAINIYGDPLRWSVQPSFGLTVMSFFRTLKYPPSLLYLLMTLGPAILTLGLIDRVRASDRNPLRVFGQVPMFYYICHFYLIHATALVLARLRYGRWDVFLHFPGQLLGLPDPGFPKDWGYSLGFVYAAWLAILTVLYFACLWYVRRVRAR